MNTTGRQLRQCADAIVRELNAHQFAVSFKAARVNRPLYGLADLATLIVSVMPVTRTTETATRGEDQITLRVDVGLQVHFATADKQNTDSDPLLDLGEEICEHFARAQLTGADGSSFFQALRTVYGDEDSPFYDLDHAHSLEVFTGVASLYFITFREVAQ
jgi:hypothetical protein